MPRLRYQPPKYRLHKGSGQAIASLEGQRVYLGKYGSAESQRRYQQLLEEWHRRRCQQHPPETLPPTAVAESLAEVVTPQKLRAKRRGGVRITIDELIFVYRRHARTYYVKNGRITREAEMIVEVTHCLGRKHGDDYIEEFGPVELDNLRDELITDKDWSRKYINKQVTRLVAMFKWAVSKELCLPDVHAKLAALGGLKKGRTAARETPGVRSVSDAVVAATLPHLPEIVADMVRFQRLTGARPGEVCSVRPCDVDRQGKVWIYTPGEHKTEHHEKERHIYIGPKAQAILAPYLLRCQESYCFSAAETVARARRRQQETRKTTARRKQRSETNRAKHPRWAPANRYEVTSYRMAIRRACKLAGVEIWSPNRLRHSAATEIRKRFGLEAAQVVCGHQTANITQVYAERDEELARRIAGEVG